MGIRVKQTAFIPEITDNNGKDIFIKMIKMSRKSNGRKFKNLFSVYCMCAAVMAMPVFVVYAADTKTQIIDAENTTAGLKHDTSMSVGKNTEELTAGVSVILDADISLENEQLLALAQNRTVQREEIIKTNENTKTQSTLVMAKINEYVKVRKDADKGAEVLGVLYKDCGGDIVERSGGWTKIKSGAVTGWVNDDYLYFDDEAEAVAKEVGILTAYSTTQTLRVRQEADLEASTIGFISNGEGLEAMEEMGEWVSVSYEGETGYVLSEFVRVEFDIDKAESIEIIRAREEEAKAAAKAKAEAERTAKKEAVLASADDLSVLAALIQCEAGGEPYEGQVAVGSVVMNRVRSGGYPNTIKDVIYASGQFTPASKGKMETMILTGNIKSSCVQAATEVISGVCNVGDALHFRRAGNRDGLIIGHHVFW